MESKNHISIIDCNIGNIGSVIRMVEKSGGTTECITTASEVCNAEKIILPGVGHFDIGMRLLNERNLVDALHERVIEQERPLLGICLGMQLLFDSSEEASTPGLGFISGKVVGLPRSPVLRVPHMGWNEVDLSKSNPLIKNWEPEESPPRYYFVHSYHALCKNQEDLLASVEYGSVITAAVSKENIYGVQFHPEKSHRFGMELIRNFVEL